MEIILDNVSVHNKLKALNLTINSGEITVLSGDRTKEMVPRLLMGFEKITNGNIYTLNNEINNTTTSFAFFQSKIGYLFAEPNQFLTNKKIKNEVAFGLKYYGFNQINDRVSYYINLVGLDDSYLEVRSLEVEINIQKKVMLASVLAIEPEILILNFIEHGLNIKEQKDLKKLLTNLKKKNNITIILVSNNSNFFFDIADRVVLFNNNKIKLDSGTNIFYEKDITKYLDLPPIINFIKLANKSKKGLLKTNDIKELMKDIYRNVNEKR